MDHEYFSDLFGNLHTFSNALEISSYSIYESKRRPGVYGGYIWCAQLDIFRKKRQFHVVTYTFELSGKCVLAKCAILFFGIRCWQNNWKVVQIVSNIVFLNIDFARKKMKLNIIAIFDLIWEINKSSSTQLNAKNAGISLCVQFEFKLELHVEL